MTAEEIAALADQFVERAKTQMHDAGFGPYLAPNVTPPGLLYHYTSAEALLGILRDREIWATNYKYLNDFTEFSYAQDLLRAVVPDLVANASDMSKALLNAMIASPDCGFIDTDLYVACFCGQDDLLSQWRGYGSKGGYSIGFEPKLPFSNNVYGRNYLLAKVCYVKQRQLETIKWLVTEFAQAVDRVASSETLSNDLIETPIAESSFDDGKVIYRYKMPGQIYRLYTAFASRFTLFASCVKNPSFAQEDEWRLIHKTFKAKELAPSEIRFRIANGALVPYLSLPLYLEHDTHLDWGGADHKKEPNFAIKSITHGPMFHPELATRSLQMLTAKHMRGHAPIIKGSEIPVKV